MNIWSNEESARDWQNDVLLSATKECLRISLEFYPLCKFRLIFINISNIIRFKYVFSNLLAVLLDKGIIVGVQQQTSIRQSLEFPVFKLMTNVRLIYTKVY